MKKSIKIVASAAGLAALVGVGASVSAESELPDGFPTLGDGGVPAMLDTYRTARCAESNGVVVLTNIGAVYCSSGS